jgi:hypothetical protein
MGVTHRAGGETGLSRHRGTDGSPHFDSVSDNVVNMNARCMLASVQNDVFTALGPSAGPGDRCFISDSKAF